jgi:hypothetical protein
VITGVTLILICRHGRNLRDDLQAGLIEIRGRA